MSVVLADFAENPYLSPQTNNRQDAVAPVPAKPGSIGMIFGGFVLLLIGYLASNIFLVSDLYHVGLGPNGQVIPSPLAMAVNSPILLWMLYVAFAAAFVAGAVMLASQRFNSMAVVCYVMCPLAGAVYLVGSPLRIVQKYAEPVAAIYLLVGSCLFCTGATRLYFLYGQANVEFAPVAASMMTEVGLALVVGSVVKFWRIAPSKDHLADAVIVAELVHAPTTSN